MKIDNIAVKLQHIIFILSEKSLSTLIVTVVFN